MSKEGPGKERGVRKDGVRDPVRRDLSEVPEENGEHHHREKRLDDCPGRAQDSLFVPDLEVPPGQEVKQLPVTPDVLQSPGERTPAWLYNQEGSFRCRVR